MDYFYPRMKSWRTYVLVFCMLTSVGLYFHFDNLDGFPRYHHAWAQSDHLALALGFLNNGLDFFHPETFHYNPSFPEWWMNANETTITAVDFPIHNYIVAIFMKLFNTKSPGVFRIYLLIYSIIGLFYFFKFSKEIGNDNVLSFLVLIIASTSPVFVYYQAGFLPSIPCVANTLIALYFFAVHLNKNCRKDYILMILFFTLATLNRTSYAVPLIALVCFELYKLVAEKKIEMYKWGLIGLSACLIFGYAWYNAYLRSEYGSIFLSEPRPATGLKDFFEMVGSVRENWSGHFFQKTLAWIFVLIPIVPLIHRFYKTSGRSEVPTGIWFYYIIWVFGSLSFSVLMVIQFLNHDYYFIDTLFLPLLIGLSLSLSYISLPEFSYSRLVYGTLLALISIPLLSYAKSVMTLRDEDNPYDEITPVTDNFTGSKELLDSWGIPKDAKILVLESVTPNIPFILMDRKGYTSMRMERNSLNELIHWNYDYAIIQNETYVAKTFRLIPESLENLERVAGNNAITVCKYHEVPGKQTLKNLLGLYAENEVARFEQDFERGDIGPWQAQVYDSNFYFQGHYSAVVPYNYTYGLSFKVNLRDLSRTPHSVFLEGYMFKYSDINFDMALAIQSGEKVLYGRNYSLNNLVEQKEWRFFNLYYAIPKDIPEDADIVLFVYNPQGNHVFFDDLQISLF